MPSKKRFKQKCPRCGYEWLGRIERPNTCPRCKQRLDWYLKKAIENRELALKLIDTYKHQGKIISRKLIQHFKKVCKWNEIEIYQILEERGAKYEI